MSTTFLCWFKVIVWMSSLVLQTLAYGAGYNESTIVHDLLKLWKHTDKCQVGLLGFVATSVIIWCFAGRHSRSRAPVVGLPSSSDGNWFYRKYSHCAVIPVIHHFHLLQSSSDLKQLGRCDMTVLEVISNFEAFYEMKQHSVFWRRLLKADHILKSELTTKNLLRWQWLSF